MKYEWDPSDYELNSAAQAQWAEELIATIEFQGTESVLDIGCGDGKITALLAEKVSRGRVVGVDNSPSMVELASTRYANRTAHLSFEVADASRLPFDQEFDIVFSNSALHWIRDHGPVLNAVKRSLKPGGRAILRFGGKGATAEVRVVLKCLMELPEWSEYFEGFVSPFGFFDPAEYRPWVESAGLTPERIELVPRTMRHTVDGFTAWVRTTKLPYTQRVPVRLREHFIRALVTEYVERHPPGADGRVSVTMNRLDVVATRPID